MTDEPKVFAMLREYDESLSKSARPMAVTCLACGASAPATCASASMRWA